MSASQSAASRAPESAGPALDTALVDLGFEASFELDALLELLLVMAHEAPSGSSHETRFHYQLRGLARRMQRCNFTLMSIVSREDCDLRALKWKLYGPELAKAIDGLEPTEPAPAAPRTNAISAQIDELYTAQTLIGAMQSHINAAKDMDGSDEAAELYRLTQATHRQIQTAIDGLGALT